MATRGAANRGGGPATFVGGVRRFKLAWEEAELPVYGPPPSAGGGGSGSGAARKMRLRRWIRTDERTDDSNNAVPRHPSLVPVDDASIPFKSSRNAADGAAAGTAGAGAAAPAAAVAIACTAPAAAAAANGTTNGNEDADTNTTTTVTVEVPMET